MQFLIFLTHIALVYGQCNWYKGTRENRTTTTDDKEISSRPIPARSEIECVLKCRRRKNGKSFYAAKEEECYCMNYEDKKLFDDNKDNVEGELLKRHNVSLDNYDFLF